MLLQKNINEAIFSKAATSGKVRKNRGVWKVYESKIPLLDKGFRYRIEADIKIYFDIWANSCLIIFYIVNYIKVKRCSILC